MRLAVVFVAFVLIVFFMTFFKPDSENLDSNNLTSQEQVSESSTQQVSESTSQSAQPQQEQISESSQNSQPAQSAKPQKAISVSTKAIQKGRLDAQTSFIGTLRFSQSSKVASQTSGVVERVNFKVGDQVKAGASLAIANSEILKKQIESKEAKLNQAKFINERQEKELARYKNLLESDSVSLQQVESIEYEQKSQAANIASLTAELDSARVELANKNIRAPISGIIVDKKVNVGEWISAGDAICEILDNTSAEVIVDIPQSMLKNVRRNQEVRVVLDQKSYKGRIYAVIPKADENSKTLPLRISIGNDGSFVDGMGASVYLAVSGSMDGDVVPRDSIVEYGGVQSIFVVRESKAVALSVEILNISGAEAIVKGDIQRGDRVVFRGQDRLQQGVEVKEMK